MTPPEIELGTLAGLVAGAAGNGPTRIVGLTGSVAVGKSTLARDIAAALAPRMRVDIVPTDGFLFPNAVLDGRGLTLRKGFPESYDVQTMRNVLSAARHGPVVVPGYSHSLYDIDPALSRTVDRPDLLLVEGLGLAPGPDGMSPAGLLDSLLYLDAEEADLRHWFVQRFMALWRAAETDPGSFYARFRGMSEAEAAQFATVAVWEGINLPNLRDHISRARDLADVIVWKSRDHALHLVRPESGAATS